ncbi:hypothetical protein HDV00_002903 [Rhizophlyctis rosea]|nr:hypothetical protein HDV00_002903 [Rhizophlyctis rosea]
MHHSQHQGHQYQQGDPPLQLAARVHRQPHDTADRAGYMDITVPVPSETDEPDTPRRKRAGTKSADGSRSSSVTSTVSSDQSNVQPSVRGNDSSRELGEVQAEPWFCWVCCAVFEQGITSEKFGEHVTAHTDSALRDLFPDIRREDKIGGCLKLDEIIDRVEYQMNVDWVEAGVTGREGESGTGKVIFMKRKRRMDKEIYEECEWKTNGWNKEPRLRDLHLKGDGQLTALRALLAHACVGCIGQQPEARYCQPLLVVHEELQLRVPIAASGEAIAKDGEVIVEEGEAIVEYGPRPHEEALRSDPVANGAGNVHFGSMHPRFHPSCWAKLSTPAGRYKKGITALLNKGSPWFHINQWDASMFAFHVGLVKNDRFFKFQLEQEGPQPFQIYPKSLSNIKETYLAEVTNINEVFGDDLPVFEDKVYSFEYWGGDSGNAVWQDGSADVEAMLKLWVDLHGQGVAIWGVGEGADAAVALVRRLAAEAANTPAPAQHNRWVPKFLQPHIDKQLPLLLILNAAELSITSEPRIGVRTIIFIGEDPTPNEIKSFQSFSEFYVFNDVKSGYTLYTDPDRVTPAASFIMESLGEYGFEPSTPNQFFFYHTMEAASRIPRQTNDAAGIDPSKIAELTRVKILKRDGTLKEEDTFIIVDKQGSKPTSADESSKPSSKPPLKPSSKPLAPVQPAAAPTAQSQSQASSMSELEKMTSDLAAKTLELEQLSKKNKELSDLLHLTNDEKDRRIEELEGRNKEREKADADEIRLLKAEVDEKVVEIRGLQGKLSTVERMEQELEGALAMKRDAEKSLRDAVADRDGWSGDLADAQERIMELEGIVVELEKKMVALTEKYEKENGELRADRDGLARDLVDAQERIRELEGVVAKVEKKMVALTEKYEKENADIELDNLESRAELAGRDVELEIAKEESRKEGVEKRAHHPILT